MAFLFDNTKTGLDARDEKVIVAGISTALNRASESTSTVRESLNEAIARAVVLAVVPKKGMNVTGETVNHTPLTMIYQRLKATTAYQEVKVVVDTATGEKREEKVTNRDGTPKMILPIDVGGRMKLAEHMKNFILYAFPEIHFKGEKKTFAKKKEPNLKYPDGTAYEPLGERLGMLINGELNLWDYVKRQKEKPREKTVYEKTEDKIMSLRRTLANLGVLTLFFAEVKALEDRFKAILPDVPKKERDTTPNEREVKQALDKKPEKNYEAVFNDKLMTEKQRNSINRKLAKAKTKAKDIPSNKAA